MAYKLLEGIRILDLTLVYAGPMGTRLLADMGAEIIKIEAPQRPDMFTRMMSYPENNPTQEKVWDQGGYFHILNAGKKGVSLDLANEKGREIFKKLVAVSDAVMENFSPRVMEGWGLGYEELKKIKPDIIMVSMSGLGHYGPMRDTIMYMTGMENMSGLTYITGLPERPPLFSNYAYGDWMLGATGAFALLLALYNKKKTGKGQYIDVAGREAISCHIGEVIMDYTLNGRVKERNGNKDASMAPHGCYKCKGVDEWVNIAIQNEDEWNRFCEIMGNPSWTKKFSTVEERLKNQDELDRLIDEWTSQYDHHEVMERLQKASIPAGSVLSLKEVYLNPQFIARGIFEMIDHGENIGKRPVIKQMPARFSGMKSFTPKRAPRFAEDNEHVFCSLLGMSKEEVKTLEEQKVLGRTPKFPPGRPLRKDLIESQAGKGAGYFDPDYLAELRKVFGEDVGK
ncbi:MAG: CoA transferase [Thermodesulfobacteriota bacterium]|jgi:benzylsuccinate CoA-transferase BbsF subunit|nr:MAG: CoA transferase [Thermodesulfobacteriota bacterium]